MAGHVHPTEIHSPGLHVLLFLFLSPFVLSCVHHAELLSDPERKRIKSKIIVPDGGKCMRYVWQLVLSDNKLRIFLKHARATTRPIILSMSSILGSLSSNGNENVT